MKLQVKTRVKQKKIHYLIGIAIIVLFVILIAGCSPTTAQVEEKTDGSEHTFLAEASKETVETLKENIKLPKEERMIHFYLFSLPYMEIADEDWSWEGCYTFYEFVPPNQNMEYILAIEEKGDELVAYLKVDGFQTMERLNAKVLIEADNKIAIEYDEDSIDEGYCKGEILFTLKRQDGTLTTEWGAMVPLQIANEEPGEYFNKVTKFPVKILDDSENSSKLDFTIKPPHMEITEEEDRLYKEAYLSIIRSEIPTTLNGEKQYFKDLHGVGATAADLVVEPGELPDIYFEENKYYYDDFDGDGKPELIVGGIASDLYILKYNLGESEFSILYWGSSMYEKILGTGQIWYHDDSHAGVTRDRFIVLNDKGEWETVLDLERGHGSYDFYEVSIYGTEAVEVDEEKWKEITTSFFEATKNPIPAQTLEEVFGELLYEDTEPEKGNLDLPIDYDFLSETHEILEYNICAEVHSLEENSVLQEYFKEELKEQEEFEKQYSTEEFMIVPTTVEYFVFDFNGDGLEDYLVSFQGSAWEGSAGNVINILIQTEDGSLKEVCHVNVRMINSDIQYEPVAVLNEKNSGYYSFVFPWTKNRVWSYDEKTERYQTYRYSDEG